MKRILPGALLLVLAATAPDASAQIAQASAASLGLGYNTTASARSFAAIASNPAGLGHPRSAGFSLSLAPVGVRVGAGPVGRADFLEWQGRVLPDSVKAEWLDRARASGGQQATAHAEATGLAFTAGPIGFQLSSVAAVTGDLNPDAVELVLFGNAGLTGNAQDYELDGSRVDGVGLTTGALAFGMEVGEGIWAGIAGTYTIGHGAVVARDAGSFVQSDPIEFRIDFPALVPQSDDTEFPFDNGSGFGMDLGVLIERGGLTLGASVQNVFNTFAWKPEGFSYVPGQALLDVDGGDSDFDERPADQAPAELLDALEALTLRPVFSVGAELRTTSSLLISADVRKRTTGGIMLGPEYHAGVGAEWSAIGFLPLRGHFSVVSGGYQVGGGASLILGPVNLSGALAWRSHGTADRVLASAALSFGAN